MPFGEHATDERQRTAALNFPVATPLPTAAGWAARLELVLARRGERTALVRNRNLGPLRVQRPFYPGRGECHLYVLHPPGGLVAGDRLDLDIRCEAGTKTLFTTPGAGRAYRGGSAARPQVQALNLHIAAGARGEWLPQENLLFDGAWARSDVHVTLEPGARYTGWDIACLGRPAAEEAFCRGQFEQTLWLWRGERPLLGERLCIEGGDVLLDAPWGLGGCPAFGTLVTTTAEAAALELARELIDRHAEAGLLAAATALPELLVVRARARCATRLRGLFVALWRELRALEDGCAPAVPRIWAT